MDSTNRYLLDLVSKSRPPEGIVVSTDYQTAGRGQIGREWDSAAGENILMSVLLYPNFLSPSDMFYLNIMVSLAVKSMVEAYLPDADVAVKWPNDVYCNGKKICGILIQNSIEKGALKYAIIGVGVNINQKLFAHTNATSLASVSGKTYPLREIIHTLNGYIEQYYMILKSNNYKNVHNQYAESLYLKGEYRPYTDIATGARFYGTILGIDEQGKLLMKVADDIRSIQMNEIKYIYEKS